MLINFSNHPSSRWSAEQIKATTRYGSVVDLPFPIVDPEATSDDIRCLADYYVKRIVEIGAGQKITVHVMGEMTLCHAVVSMLLRLGIPCVASTSERIVIEKDNKKTSTFCFVQFREYES